MGTRIGLFLVALLAAACGDPYVGPEAPGILVISTETLGEDPDSDGYYLTPDEGESVTLLATGIDSLVLPAGLHNLVLEGVAENCTVDPGPFVATEVVSGEARTLHFEITCPLSALDVSVSTSGEHLDTDGYRLLLDGADKGFIASTGSVRLERVRPGRRMVSLGGVKANCTAAETPKAITAGGRVALVALVVTCVEPIGTVRVRAITTGSTSQVYEVLLWYRDDPWDYDDGWIDLGPVSPNGGVSTEVAAGTYWVELANVDPACGITATEPSGPFSVEHGSVVDVLISVRCPEVEDPWGY